jgi:lysine-N-methylase
VLLHPDPIQFIVVDADPALAKRTHLAPAYRFPLQGSGDPTQITTLNDLRGLIIGILQFRELELGARLMVLGFLLDDVDKVVSAPGFRNAAEIVPVLQGYADFLSSPQTAAVQFSQLAGNLPRKLHLIGGVITELLASQAKPRLNACLLAASEGLLAEGGDDAALVQRYTAALNENFAPFLREHGYMLENYLVNQVYSRLFPFTRASYLDLYRELVCSLAVLQVLLVGMAARDGHLETRQALQLLQSFARKAHHNPTYLDKLLNAAGATGPGAFVDVMWLLKDE